MFIWIFFFVKFVQKNSMEKISSWEASSSLVSTEIPRILWNPNVPHSVYKILPLVPILSHINPVHSLPLHFRKNAF